MMTSATGASPHDVHNFSRHATRSDFVPNRSFPGRDSDVGYAKKYVESYDCDHICIEGENISFSDNARNLGVYFDCTFSMEHHVKQLCKSLFF